MSEAKNTLARLASILPDPPFLLVLVAPDPAVPTPPDGLITVKLAKSNVEVVVMVAGIAEYGTLELFPLPITNNPLVPALTISPSGSVTCAPPSVSV